MEIKQISLDKWEQDGQFLRAEVTYSLSHAGRARNIVVRVAASQVGNAPLDSEIFSKADAEAKESAAVWQASIDSEPAEPVKTSKAADRALDLGN